MATNPDFEDLFRALCGQGAEFIVIGGHAVMFYTEPRYTKEIDIWVRPTTENAECVYQALVQFGAPMADLEVSDLAIKGTIFQIGIAPNRIDIVTRVEAVDFDEAWRNRQQSTYGGVPISLLGYDELLRNKRAVGRLQDQIDVEKLELARPHLSLRQT
jgi:hypothetical protein